MVPLHTLGLELMGVSDGANIFQFHDISPSLGDVFREGDSNETGMEKE